MKITMTFLLVASLTSFATAKDPTVPSDQLKFPSTTVATDKPTKTIDLRLKAMVMQDQDHGSAILVSGERKLFLKLSRTQSVRFAIQGVEFEVIDFDGKTIQVKSSAGTQLVN